jgi:hypothetical protein
VLIYQSFKEKYPEDYRCEKTGQGRKRKSKEQNKKMITLDISSVFVMRENVAGTSPERVKVKVFSYPSPNTSIIAHTYANYCLKGEIWWAGQGEGEWGQEDKLSYNCLQFEKFQSEGEEVKN